MEDVGHAIEQRVEIRSLELAFDELELPSRPQIREIALFHVTGVVVGEAIEADDWNAAEPRL